MTSIFDRLTECANEPSTTKHEMRKVCSDASYIIRDMLAALEDARMVLTQGKGVPATAPVIKDIDAAIAKAKGR